MDVRGGVGGWVVKQRWLPLTSWTSGVGWVGGCLKETLVAVDLVDVGLLTDVVGGALMTFMAIWSMLTFGATTVARALPHKSRSACIAL